MTGDGTGRVLYIERRLITTTRALLLLVAVAVQFGLNGNVLRTLPEIPPAEAGVYVALAGTGLACGVAVLVRGRATAVIRWLGVLVLLACSVVMATTNGPDPVSHANHWSLGLIGWYALVFLYGQPLPRIGLFLLAHAVVSVWPVLAAAPAKDVPVAVATMTGVFGVQVGVAMGARLVSSIAGAAASASRTEEELRIQGEAAAAIARDHDRRYRDLRASTLPLLAGLASGELDPRDRAVRRLCAIDAARMRRLFSLREDVPDRLVHELNAIIDIAERHDVSVQLSVMGTPGEVPEGVRRELLTPIAEALVTAGNAPDTAARVTVMHAPARVRVSVRVTVGDQAPEPPVARPGADPVELTTTVSNGQLLLETSWPSPPP